MNLQTFFKNHYSHNVELKYHMFCICSLLGTITSLFGFILCIIIMKFSVVSLATFIALVFMLILTTYGYRTKVIDLTVIIMSCFLNLIVFPAIFLTTGALYSNAPIFFVMGIFIATPLLVGRKRIILFIIEIIFYSIVIALCYFIPNLTYEHSNATHTTMLLFSFIIVAFYIFSSTIMITQQYQREKMRVDELNKLLMKQAISDPLTHLYNRKYLSNYLD